MSVRAMKAGAVTVLTKPVEDLELVAAVTEALHVDEAARQARSRERPLQQRFSTLTPREHEVLTFVVAGRRNKQIAAELGTAEKTVKVHRARHAEDGGSLRRRARASGGPGWSPCESRDPELSRPDRSCVSCSNRTIRVAPTETLRRARRRRPPPRSSLNEPRRSSARWPGRVRGLLAWW